MPPTVSKFAELSAQLDKNITDIESKKKAMDVAEKSLQAAGEAYQKAVSDGESTRQALLNVMNESFPKELKSKIG